MLFMKKKLSTPEKTDDSAIKTEGANNPSDEWHIFSDRKGIQ